MELIALGPREFIIRPELVSEIKYFIKLYDRKVKFKILGVEVCIIEYKHDESSRFVFVAKEVSLPIHSSVVDRILFEKKELDDRWGKLIVFMRSYNYLKLSLRHRELLLEQKTCMEKYSTILEMRLRLFDKGIV